MQLIDSLETYAYETIKDLASEKEEIKCNYNKAMQKKKKKKIKWKKKKKKKKKKKRKINFDDVIKENIKNIMQISHKFLIIYTE